MKTLNIDALNIGLIVVSLVIAYIIPFELFLGVYAILGPLHYLTEINWLERKDFFMEKKKWAWAIIPFGVLFLYAYLPTVPFFSFMQHWPLALLINEWAHLTITIPLFIAFGSQISRSSSSIWIAAITGLIFGILLKESIQYSFIVASLLPTLIHVFLFTLLFMLYGALKSNSRLGIISSLILILVPFLIWALPLDPKQYVASRSVREIFVSNNFHSLTAKITHALGVRDGKTFAFDGLAELKIQVFIAFAYTYHYLNWFTKTTVIGWHKTLTQKRSFFILVIWVLSVALYAYDYRSGFIGLLFLSVLHVYLEFPLNILSIKGIFQSLSRKA